MKSRLALLILISGIIALIYACKNDNLEEIHPNIYCDTCGFICDTSGAITYTNDIQQILSTSCGSTDISCHKTGNTPQVNLDNYSESTDAATSGDMLACILHQPGNHPMPNSGGFLDKCSTWKIMAWINRSEPQ
jgi:hypothetical protein